MADPSMRWPFKPAPFPKRNKLLKSLSVLFLKERSMNPEVEAQLKEIVENYSVTLFMKGNPTFPQCGFSARAVAIAIGMIFLQIGQSGATNSRRSD